MVFQQYMDGGGRGFHFPGDGNPGSLCVFQEKISGKESYSAASDSAVCISGAAFHDGFV